MLLLRDETDTNPFVKKAQAGQSFFGFPLQIKPEQLRAEAFVPGKRDHFPSEEEILRRGDKLILRIKPPKNITEIWVS